MFSNAVILMQFMFKDALLRHYCFDSNWTATRSERARDAFSKIRFSETKAHYRKSRHTCPIFFDV